MNFLLKLCPYEEEQVTVQVHERSELTEQIEQLVRQWDGDTGLTVTDGGRQCLSRLSYKQIACIAVISGKTVIIDDNGTEFYSRLRLYELESRLPQCFIRINKSAIANENQILRFEAMFNGGVNVVFRCGYSDYVSRRCFADIKRRLNQK